MEKHQKYVSPAFGLLNLKAYHHLKLKSSSSSLLIPRMNQITIPVVVHQSDLSHPSLAAMIAQLKAEFL